MRKGEDHFCRYWTENHRRAGSYTAGTKVGFPLPHLAYIKSGSCRVEYGDGETLTLRPGDAWYIPKGLPYASHWSTENDVIFYKLEFEADDFSLKYRTMQVFRLPELEAHFTRLCDEGNQPHPFDSLASFFHILSALTPLLKQEQSTSFDRIIPALKYLQQWDSVSIQVSELAVMCCLSPSRFYEVFREAVGESPINYKNKIKLSHAKILLHQGRTLDEVCELLHFSSPSFLRRMMKKHLGITPKEAKQGGNI